MVEIRPSRPEEQQELKSLFRRCFGDSDEFVNGYYRDFCAPEQSLVVMEDGELNSMLSLLDMTFRLPDGAEIPVGYVYGLATNPHIQGKGYARQLMAYADERLKQAGKKCMVLVPAAPSLHRYFESLGFVECFSTRKVEIMSSALHDLPPTGEGCSFARVDPEAYNRIRDQKLTGTPYIAYDDELVRFQRYCGEQSGGDLYRLEIDGEEGCVAIEFVQKSRLLAKELLISPQNQERAVQLIFENVMAGRYHIRTPACWDGMKGSYNQSFGMAKWYDKELQQKLFHIHQDAYLGLAFD